MAFTPLLQRPCSRCSGSHGRDGGDFVRVLDDYHLIDAKPIDHALAFLFEHLPPQMHLVIATSEDPQLPLARLRAQGQLTELRATDLRFTPSEAAGFLNQGKRIHGAETRPPLLAVPTC